MSPKDKSSKKNSLERLRRPTWVMRLCATALDVGLCVYTVTLVAGGLLSEPIFLFLSVAVYYLAFEYFWQKTPGKWLLRMKLLTKERKPPTRLRLAMRTLLRFGSVPMMFSWKRTTLLDLLSGIRVEKADVPSSLSQSGEKAPVGWR